MEENDILIKNVADVDSIKQPNDDYDSCECSTDDYISELKTTISESENKYKYLLAEFENYKKRTNKEKLLMHTKGVEDTIINVILPILDDFERAFKHNELAEGGMLIYKKLDSSLQSLGVEGINIIENTTKFNVDEHEAISVTGDTGVISQVVLPGYKLNGKVIRYAKVIVA